MHFLSGYQGSFSVFLLYLSSTYSMNSNLEFGKQFLLTYSAFCMQWEGQWCKNSIGGIVEYPRLGEGRSVGSMRMYPP